MSFTARVRVRYGSHLPLFVSFAEMEREIPMLRKPRTSPKLFSDFNTLQFASVMSMVVFVMLVVFMTVTPYHTHGGSADLPKVLHPIAMPGALREDAMHVFIMRDGRVYFGTDQILPSSLAEEIQLRLQDHGIERKVYITADARHDTARSK